MKPAICCICGTTPTPARQGKWILFKDYAKENKEGLSHPRGMEYFCENHVQIASSLTHLELPEALEKLEGI